MSEGEIGMQTAYLVAPLYTLVLSCLHLASGERAGDVNSILLWRAGERRVGIVEVGELVSTINSIK